MPRFVILRHEPSGKEPRALHWDLMFERDGALRTWALEREPVFDVEIRATRLPDHRLAYLDYEGPVSNDRGRVTRWDGGTYALEIDQLDVWRAGVHGSRITAQVTLSQGARDQFWRVVFSAAPTRG